MKRFWWILFLAGPVIAGESGTLIRSAELKAKPFADAQTITTLSEATSIEIIETQGAWMQIKTGKSKAGWVRVFNVRTNASGKGDDSGMSKLNNLARTGSSGTTVTTGVKGLSAEELRQARPNPQELKKLESFSSNKVEAQAFARQAKLSSRQIEYLTASDN